MDHGILDEAYDRFAHTGPEWGEDQLTNHGPMAVEVLVRRGHGDAVAAWVDAYERRLEELPGAGARITGDGWREALGDGRIGDWSAYFEEELRAAPWRDVLATWWPRLLPGIVAGATHGVIRTGHAVRTLLAGDDSAPAVTELARGLAFWAARSLAVPGVPAAATAPAGSLGAGAALAAVPRIPDRSGTVAHRFGQFAELPQWPAALHALRVPAAPEEARSQLEDLVAAATARYLAYGHGSPVLLVHTATAPNAVLHTLPALPESLWARSTGAVWTASAALMAAYAPAQPAPREALPGAGTAGELVERAAAHGDEHVIKFTDTAVEAYEHSGDPDTLAAAARIADLVPSPWSA